MRRVTIVLADGLRPDVITPGLMPSLHALGAAYVTARRAATVRPSTTVAALTSLATGVAPEHHRLTHPSLGCVRRLRALPCVGRELARRGLPSQVVTGRLDPLTWALVAGLASAAGIGRLTADGTAAREVARRALGEAGSQPDGVLFVYLTDCDRAGHADGWMSPAYLAAAGEVDAAVGRLSALADDSLLLVLADHGGGGVTPTDHDEPHPDNDRIPLVVAGPGVARRHEVTRAVSLLDVPPTVLARFGIAIPPAYAGRPLDEAFARPDATAPEKVAA